MTAKTTAAATARRAAGFVVAIAMAVCSCGGVATGFVLPSALTSRGVASGTHVDVRTAVSVGLLTAGGVKRLGTASAFFP